MFSQWRPRSKESFPHVARVGGYRKGRDGNEPCQTTQNSLVIQGILTKTSSASDETQTTTRRREFLSSVISLKPFAGRGVLCKHHGFAGDLFLHPCHSAWNQLIASPARFCQQRMLVQSPGEGFDVSWRICFYATPFEYVAARKYPL